MRSWLLLLTMVMSGAVWAHKASDAFVYLDTSAGRGRIDLSLRDLEPAVGLDRDGDGRITWGEVISRDLAVRAYLNARLRLSQAGVGCMLDWERPALGRHSDGYYAVYQFRTDCGAAKPWTLSYRLLFDLDPLHRGLLQWTAGDADGLGVLSPQQTSFETSVGRTWVTAFADYFQQGMVHLWQGYDHMLFLTALLLPAVMKRRDGRWQVANRLGPVVSDVMVVVTLFSLAHSLTLGLASLDIAQLPSALVETLIALSITVAGVQVLYPICGERSHWLAFGFGLVHGFGFANVLFELTPSVGQRLIALAGFNLGVEAAQILLVLVVLPLLFRWRYWSGYQRWLMPGSAYSIAAVGLVWAWERGLA